jgi:ABC-type multidrug transport system permease subunit
LSNVLHDTVVTCTPLETNIFQPPQGQTCGQFLGPFLKIGFGALYNPNATANCEYCRYSTGDQYLVTLDYNWGDRWRNFGLIWVYVFFNLGMLLLVMGVPRVLRQRRKGGKGKRGSA